MNLEEQKVIGTNQVYISDSLEAPLLKTKITSLANTNIPSGNELIVYVDKESSTTPTDERKQFVFELSSPLQFFDGISDVFNLGVVVKNNDIVLEAFVERKIGTNDSGKYVLPTPLIEEIDGFLINLFENSNFIYTNYTNAGLEIVYTKNDDLNKLFLNNALYYNHKQKNKGEFSVNDIYFKDAFTKTGDKLNLNINNANVECLTSKNNKFSLDENGNLVVNSITANSGLTYNDSSICNLIYPVGSIYLSVNGTDPNLLFGGTWAQMKDRFLLGAGDIYNVGSTGGEANHTLTTSEIPSHTHTWSQDTCSNPGNHTHVVGADKDGGGGTNRYTVHISGGSTANGPELSPSSGSAGSHTHNISGTNYATGGNGSHNNMPPYTTVYMWKRIA